MNTLDPAIARFEQELDAAGVQAPSAITIGTFDGVHRGHQQLLRRTAEWAKEHQATSLAITFDPHPRRVVRPEDETLSLMPVAERVGRIKELGVEHVALVTFTRELSQLSPEEFMQRLKQRMHLQHLVAGPDFALGRGRSGTVERLAEIGRELGYDVEVLEPVVYHRIVVKSTALRKAVRAGDVRGAALLLGRPYALTGVVVAGDRRGRTIGFPTANLDVDPNQALPAHGVYAVYAVVDGTRYPAVMNIGVRPSFGLVKLTLEVHLLDVPSIDLYGRQLRVEFVDHLRGEQKFPSVDALVAQIRDDCETARGVFGIEQRA